MNKTGRAFWGALTLSVLILSAVGLQFASTATATTSAAANSKCGVASWYALTSQTASGEMMDPAKLTAAHKTLRFGTKLRVKNKSNGKSVIVRINDRGPFTKGRFIDVSKAAAYKLGFINAGTAQVCIDILK